MGRAGEGGREGGGRRRMGGKGEGEEREVWRECGGEIRRVSCLGAATRKP